MTYQVLARKWRPKSFASLIGQEHVVRALTHALDGGRLHHAYLFTGTRGVGKTTLSRIFAKALNCETGVTSTPCGVCRACREIDEGRFVDYVEMDAASNRGVDEMAALLERAVYAPVDARFKVYMIDEVHMLTNHAFNAMLKTLEEPPSHVKFILATTDPQKIPVTVLSRCLQFNLKQMPAGHIVSHLENILGEEKIPFDVAGAAAAVACRGRQMRDALSLTDQAIAYSANQVTEEAVRGMLGALDQSYLIRLLDALADGDGEGVLSVADEMALRSLSFSTALQDLAGLLHRIAWAQFAPASVLDEWPEAEDVRRFADTLSAEQVQLFYQIATVGRSELGLAPDEYAGFTMTLLRMLAFEPRRRAGWRRWRRGECAIGALVRRVERRLRLRRRRARALPCGVGVREARGSGGASCRHERTGDCANRRLLRSPRLNRTPKPSASTRPEAPPSDDACRRAALGRIRAKPDEPLQAPATRNPAAASDESDASRTIRSWPPRRSSSVGPRRRGMRMSSPPNPRAKQAATGAVPPTQKLRAHRPADAAALGGCRKRPAAAHARRTDCRRCRSKPPPRAATAADKPPRRAGGASAALDVLRSAGMRVTSDRAARCSAGREAEARRAESRRAPRVQVPVPTPRCAPRAATARRRSRPSLPSRKRSAKQGGSSVPPWEDMPPDDYLPASAEDGYFMPPDDGFMPAFDSGPDDLSVSATHVPVPGCSRAEGRHPPAATRRAARCDRLSKATGRRSPSTCRSRASPISSPSTAN